MHRGAKVSALSVYPIKGCAAVPVDTSEVDAAGLAHDRTFMVVTEDGIYRTQRGSPSLARIQPEVHDGGKQLTLHAPGLEDLTLDVDLGRQRREVVLFGAPMPAVDQGDDAARWLTEALAEPSRLVRVAPEHERQTSGHTPGTAAFADSNAITVVSLSSLDTLNEHIIEAGGEPLPMNRFRANIVIEGWPQPHTEDLIRVMRVGSAHFGYAKLDIRCVVTTVDQRAGVKDGPEPIRTLARYRRAADGGVAFGMKASVTRPGTISVGDQLAVDSWGASEL